MAENIFNTNVPLRGDAFDTWNEWYKNVYGGSKSQYDAGMTNLMQMQFAQQQAETAYKRSIDYNTQLQHLMATGMSRAAAMQALSSPNTDAPVPSLIAPDGGLATAQQVGQVVGTAVQFMGGIGQIINTGISLGLAASTIKVNSAQQSFIDAQTQSALTANTNARLQLDAMTDVAAFTQVIENWRSRSNSELPSSLFECIKSLQGISYDDMPDVFTMSRDRWQKALENPYFYPAMLQSYQNIYNGDYDLFAMKRRVIAEADFAQYNSQKCQEEINDLVATYKLKGQQLKTEEQQTDFVKQSIQESKARQYQASSQGALAYAQYEYQFAENESYFAVDEKSGKRYIDLKSAGLAKEQYYAGALAELGFEFNEDYLNPLLKAQLEVELKAWQGLPDMTMIRHRRNELLSNAQTREFIASIALLKAQDAENFQTSHPNYAYLFNLLDSYDCISGCIDWMANITAHVAGGAAYGAAKPATIVHNYGSSK